MGQGYDVHRLAEGRKLILGGVEIPYEKGLLGHSDADVLTHAVMDAILGALALGDIGQHFPDTDPAFEGADSVKLLKAVVRLVGQKGWKVHNLDATVAAERPKLAPYIGEMRVRLADAMKIPVERVSIKATTRGRARHYREGRWDDRDGGLLTLPWRVRLSRGESMIYAAARHMMNDIPFGMIYRPPAGMKVSLRDD